MKSQYIITLSWLPNPASGPIWRLLQVWPICQEYYIMMTGHNYQWWIVKTYTPHNVSELLLTPAFQTGITPIPCPVFKLWLWQCTHMHHNGMAWFNVLSWNKYRSVLKKWKNKNPAPVKWLKEHDSPLKIPPAPKGIYIYMKITMLSLLPSTSKAPLLPSCAVSGWHICRSFNTHWQIYQGNVHLWWACFYIWDRGGLGAKIEKEKRDVKTGRGYTTYRMWTTHTYTQTYSLLTQSSQQLALPPV